jgi:hypothetical protein
MGKKDRYKVFSITEIPGLEGFLEDVKTTHGESAYHTLISSRLQLTLLLPEGHTQLIFSREKDDPTQYMIKAEKGEIYGVLFDGSSYYSFSSPECVYAALFVPVKEPVKEEDTTYLRIEIKLNAGAIIEGKNSND